MRLQVRADQHDFVSPSALTLPDAERSPGSTPMAILHGELVVGYYRIEHSARSVITCEVGDHALALRSFQIDAAWQGRGFASQALVALLADMAQRHPSAERVVLTVNMRNTAAITLYRNGGFEGNVELYHGVRSGPQYLLCRDLP